MLRIYASLAAAFAMFTYGAYKALLVFPPISSPENPVMEELYRNVFFHVPINASGFLGFTITLFASILYLKTRDMKYDLIASRAAKVGVLFITFTLLTGMVWAKPAWGSYWNWDPRETTALIMWFVYLGYFALREAIADEKARARASAVLGIFGYSSGIFTLLSTRIFPSLHPPTFGLELEPEMGMALGIMITASIIVFLNLMYLEMRIERLKQSVGGR
ncbi:MAG: cytochrome c biogenesis protein CcsA [Euryarchaeota archaeon]|nr:cytochrome c biogenesis protein CcsA [Euryarchaeota archaeon]